jgi:hypothetical protein
MDRKRVTRVIANENTANESLEQTGLHGPAGGMLISVQWAICGVQVFRSL